MTHEEIVVTVREIAEGRATPAQMGAFLMALRSKGETVDEIASFASTFREYSLLIRPAVNGRVIDTCGTGGDKIKTFNVSTIAAFVAAGAGAIVAKHGNRSVSSKCGSADLLERLGTNVEMDPSKVKEAIERIGVGFMYAPAFHPAMKHVAPVRKELGVRTIFNLMGPIINPARVNAQLLGVYSADLVPKIAKVLEKLGSEEAIVIHGLEGMDEISVTGMTLVSWLKKGQILTREFSPEEFGVRRNKQARLEVSGVEDSARVAIGLLNGEVDGAAIFDMVLANSAAALVVAGKADTFSYAVEIANESLKSGAALKKLEELVRFSGGDLSRIELHATN